MEGSLFSTNGRIRRSTFWARYLIGAIINFVAYYISEPNLLGVNLVSLTAIPVLMFMISQGIKRVQDVGKNQWCFFIPFYGLILTLTNGTEGSNIYGENPKEKNPHIAEFENAIITLLVSAFISCTIYAIISLTNVITNVTIKNIIFTTVFTFCNFYFLNLFIKKTSAGQDL